MIAIVDYGMGNVRSLANAFAYLGEDVVISDDPDLMDQADRLVLPGVGAFGDAMQAITALQKNQAELTRNAKAKPQAHRKPSSGHGS